MPVAIGVRNRYRWNCKAGQSGILIGSACGCTACDENGPLPFDVVCRHRGPSTTYQLDHSSGIVPGANDASPAGGVIHGLWVLPGQAKMGDDACAKARLMLMQPGERALCSKKDDPCHSLTDYWAPGRKSGDGRKAKQNVCSNNKAKKKKKMKGSISERR